MLSLAEVTTRVECYIKGEESNAEKKVCDVKKCVPNTEGSHQQRKINYTSPIKDKITSNRIYKTMENIMPLNTRCEQIWHKVLHLHNIPTLPAPKEDVMVPES